MNENGTEKTGVIWFYVKDGTTDKEIEQIVMNFWKNNNKDVLGGKFHILESREHAKKLVARIEKALKLGNRIILNKDNEMIFDKDNTIIN